MDPSLDTAGWSSTDFGTTIYKEDKYAGRHNAPTLTLHAVARVVPDVCAAKGSQFEDVGPTVEDLTTALANQVGIESVGPTDVMLGGHPAKKVVLTFPADFPCGGPRDAGSGRTPRGRISDS